MNRGGSLAEGGLLPVLRAERLPLAVLAILIFVSGLALSLAAAVDAKAGAPGERTAMCRSAGGSDSSDDIPSNPCCDCLGLCSGASLIAAGGASATIGDGPTLAVRLFPSDPEAEPIRLRLRPYGRAPPSV